MADAAEDLARAPRAYIVAAAGCGKTEVAVRAAGIHSEGRQLLLTHTHAGVKALRDRLKQVGVPSKRVHVDTIAGFALRYAASFPKLSGLSITEPTTTAEWAAVYKAARRLMDIRIGRSILDNSYSGVFVDEYQDCIMPQHDLVMTLADTLPCRVLLDPLQGIFGFAGPLVSHETHLDPTFERLSDLTTPWRWRERNPNLGEWLVEIRAGLETGRTINLNNAPVARRTATYRDQISACLRRTRNAGSAVAIGQWPRDCHSIASRLRGGFTCMEPMECPDLLHWAGRIEETAGPARAATIIEFASSCMTRVRTVLQSATDSFNRGEMPPVRGGPETRLAISALIEVASDPGVHAIVDAMRSIEQIPDRVLYRRELWREMARTIRICEAETQPTLPGAAWHIRDRGRQAGRRVEPRTVSRTLLIKGLEFDHAIVLNGDAHDAPNLYVALTRSSTSLTVLSNGPTITPRTSSPSSTRAEAEEETPHALLRDNGPEAQ